MRSADTRPELREACQPRHHAGRRSSLHHDARHDGHGARPGDDHRRGPPIGFDNAAAAFAWLGRATFCRSRSGFLRWSPPCRLSFCGSRRWAATSAPSAATASGAAVRHQRAPRDPVRLRDQRVSCPYRPDLHLAAHRGRTERGHGAGSSKPSRSPGSADGPLGAREAAWTGGEAGAKGSAFLARACTRSEKCRRCSRPREDPILRTAAGVLRFRRAGRSAAW